MMSFRSVCVALVFVSLMFDVFAKNVTKEPCGVHNPENPYPWLVGIQHDNKNQSVITVVCTGALIGKRYVLTKAECFGNKEDILEKSVLLGIYNAVTKGTFMEGYRINRDVIKVEIETVIKYSSSLPLFSSFNYHDVALVVLREMVSYTDVIRPICLPSEDILQSKSTGWDLHHVAVYHDDDFNFALYETSTTLVNRTVCNKARYRLFFLSSHICANDTLDSKICLRRGALLMNKRGDIYELVGLSEHVSYCSSARIFTDLYLFMNWLYSKIPEWSRDCGRRKVEHVELIVNGQVSRVGDWPWHVAIYKLVGPNVKYICGGTLISKTMVLTAAHCATVNGRPVVADSLNVVLGKYNLIGRDSDSRESSVEKVIVHENFAPRSYLENDIALLKLKTEAIYSNLIQPACWSNGAYDRLLNNSVFGTVVGWGFDQSKTLSFQLNQATLPLIPEETCIRKRPLFYANALSGDKKFCAGWANGTSTCNGDSGGGYLVFIPDSSSTNSTDVPGSWYVRGIVSLTIALKNESRCDPDQYVIFTDVAKYAGWIQKHIND